MQNIYSGDDYVTRTKTTLGEKTVSIPGSIQTQVIDSN